MFEIQRMEWTEDVSVGIAEIDEQHKELFARLNGLIDAVERGAGASVADDIFNFLEGYVIHHFTNEIREMKAAGFPGLKPHSDQHMLFRSTLSNLKDKYDTWGATDSLLSLLQTQICGWIVTHIKRNDKKFAEFLIENKGKHLKGI